MTKLQEYQLRNGGSVVIIGRTHEHTPYVVTTMLGDQYAFEQDPINGHYCTTYAAAQSIVKSIRL